MTNAMQGRCYTIEYDQKLEIEVEKDSLILDLNENLSTGLVPRGRHMWDNLGSVATTVETEYYSYQFDSLVSDYGGSLGLFISFFFFALAVAVMVTIKIN